MAQNDSPQEQYDQGYTGYKASKPKDDPYASHSTQQYPPPDGYGQQQQQQQQQQYQAPDSYQQASYGQQQQQQQFATYQPPLSALGGMDASESTSLGLSARLEAALSYVFVWLGGLFFFLFERRNRFVRFAAAQSFLFFVPALIILGILRFLAGFFGGIPLIGLLFGPLLGIVATIVGILIFLVWLYLIIQTLRGRTVRLPLVSTYAQALVDRTTRRRTI
jgi:uncharacterized membrane protein